MNNIFFDFEYIKKNKPEFKNLTNENILNQYIKNPSFIFNKNLESFDYNYYTSYYVDLKHMNYLQACCHYLMHGIKENRICNNNNDINDINNINLINKYFDYQYYINKYNDLSKFNKKQAINHLLKYGINEKRLFNSNLENIKEIIDKITNDKFLIVCMKYLQNDEVTNNNDEEMNNDQVTTNDQVTNNDEETNQDKIKNLIKKKVSIIIQNVINNNSFQVKEQIIEKENRKKELMNKLLMEKLEKIKVINHERDIKIIELNKEYNEKIRLI
jgi:hypothetical protein